MDHERRTAELNSIIKNINRFANGYTDFLKITNKLKNNTFVNDVTYQANDVTYQADKLYLAPGEDKSQSNELLEYSEFKTRSEKIDYVEDMLRKPNQLLIQTGLISLSFKKPDIIRFINKLYKFNERVYGVDKVNHTSFTEYECRVILLYNDDDKTNYIPYGSEENNENKSNSITTPKPVQLTPDQLNRKRTILTFIDNLSREQKIKQVIGNLKIKEIYDGNGIPKERDLRPFVFNLYANYHVNNQQTDFSINELKTLNKNKSIIDGNEFKVGSYTDVPMSKEEKAAEMSQNANDRRVRKEQNDASKKANILVDKDRKNNKRTRTQNVSLNAFRGIQTGGSAKTRRRRARSMTRKRKSCKHTTSRCRPRRQSHSRRIK